jgi:hypothetical protein
MFAPGPGYLGDLCQRAGWQELAVASNVVIIPVQVVDVVAHDSNRTLDVLRTVTATTGAVHVTGDRNAGAGVVRVAVRCWLGLGFHTGADEGHLAHGLSPHQGVDEVSSDLDAILQRQP